MFKITDVLSLGEDYTISDSKGNVINVVQVIPYLELLNTTLGPYTDDFGSYQTYLDKSIATLSGLDNVDPTRILWYATSDDEVVLSELIEYAINNGYNKIILEHLDELE